MCSDEVDERRSNVLKTKLRDYFEKTVDCSNVTMLTDRELTEQPDYPKVRKLYREISLTSFIITPDVYV